MRFSLAIIFGLLTLNKTIKAHVGLAQIGDFKNQFEDNALLVGETYIAIAGPVAGHGTVQCPGKPQHKYGLRIPHLPTLRTDNPPKNTSQLDLKKVSTEFSGTTTDRVGCTYGDSSNAHKYEAVVANESGSKVKPMARLKLYAVPDLTARWNHSRNERFNIDLQCNPLYQPCNFKLYSRTKLLLEEFIIQQWGINKATTRILLQYLRTDQGPQSITDNKIGITDFRTLNFLTLQWLCRSKKGRKIIQKNLASSLTRGDINKAMAQDLPIKTIKWALSTIGDRQERADFLSAIASSEMSLNMVKDFYAFTQDVKNVALPMATIKWIFDITKDAPNLREPLLLALETKSITFEDAKRVPQQILSSLLLAPAKRSCEIPEKTYWFYSDGQWKSFQFHPSSTPEKRPTNEAFVFGTFKLGDDIQIKSAGAAI